MFSLQTLYEQLTLYCNKIDQQYTDKYLVELYQQPDTPIIIFVYWNTTTHTIHSIAYQTKEN